MNELNIKSSTIEKGFDLLKVFLGKAIGPWVEELGLGFSDSMRIRRAKNQLKAFQKMKEIAERDKVEIKQINFKALFPLLEGIALEEDEELQDLWANLFVNYIDSKKTFKNHVFPDILRQLSTSEVIILKELKQSSESTLSISKRFVSNDQAFVCINNRDVLQSELDNLMRLGIITTNGDFLTGSETSERAANYSDGGYSLKELGHDFINACQR